MLLRTAVVVAVVLSIQEQIRPVRAHKQHREVILDTEMPAVLEIKQDPPKEVLVVAVQAVPVQMVHQLSAVTAVQVVNIASRGLLHTTPQAAAVVQEQEHQLVTELVVLVSVVTVLVQAHIQVHKMLLLTPVQAVVVVDTMVLLLQSLADKVLVVS
jgi:hypothetical protein